MAFGLRGPGVMAGDLHFAQVGAHLAGGEAKKCALAGAVVSDQAGDAGAQFERDLVNADDGAVPFRDVLEEEDGRYRLSRGGRGAGDEAISANALTLALSRAEGEEDGGPLPGGEGRLAHDLDAPRPPIQVDQACDNHSCKHQSGFPELRLRLVADLSNT